MSVFDENVPPADAEPQLDRLVDGELSEADRRSLLLQLEHQPDGWRRCALAFLEAQCWKAELGLMASPPAAKKASAEAIAQPRPAGRLAEDRWVRLQRWRQYTATTLTIGASFLIALVLGMGLRGSWSDSLHSPDNSIVQKTISEVPFTAAEQANSHAQPAKAASGDWETVTLAAANSPGGSAEPFRVQALRRNTLDKQLLEDVPSVIPPELQQVFEQSGHHVVQQREIVPVELKDGRRLVVPVDRIQIHYVGRPSL